MARSIGVAEGTAFPFLVLAGGVAGLLVVLNLIAVAPAFAARRLRVAEALRSE
jgi:hypothetical protein